MNSINVIAPYRHLDLWVFDDPARGLDQEPFVGGTGDIIDQGVAHIPDAEKGFQLIFSDNPFPGFQYELEHRRPELNGNTYYSKDLEAEGWLCPALLKYFEAPPASIYVKVGPLVNR
jgi:hypothetical protein